MSERVVAATREVNSTAQQPMQTKSPAHKNETLYVAVKEGLFSNGSPLDPATRTYFESKLGHDFGNIRVHSNPEAAESAKSIEADAYTVGDDIVFAQNRFRPGTLSGNSLLAHELVHTVQQRGAPGTNSKPSDFELSSKSDGIESEASSVAEHMIFAKGVHSINSVYPAGGAAIVARQQATVQESPSVHAAKGGSVVADPVKNIVSTIVADLQRDPDDRAGNTRRRLDSLRQPARQEVIESVQSSLPVEQRPKLLSVLAQPPAERAAPNIQRASSKTPQEIAASISDRSFIQREVSREAAGPNVNARFTDKGPVVLMPAREPDQTPRTRATTHRDNLPKAPARPHVSAMKSTKILSEAQQPARSGLVGQELADALPSVAEPEVDQATVASEPSLSIEPAVASGAPGRLQAAAEQDKRQLLEESAAHKTAIESATESEVSKTRDIANRQISQTRSYFSQKRNAITTQVEQQKVALRSQALQDATQLESESLANSTDFQRQMQQKRTDMTAYAQEQRAEPGPIVQDEIARADSQLETAAGESQQAGDNEAARHPGSEDPAPDQRQAAREVGRNSASDIREKKPAIAQDLRSRLDGFSGDYMQYANTVNSRMTEAENTVVPAFGEISTRSAGLIRDGESATMQAIESRASADLQSLTLLETTTVNGIMTARTATIRQTRATSRLAKAKVDEAARAITMQIDSVAAEGEIPPPQRMVTEPGVNPEEAANGASDTLEESLAEERALASESRNQLREAVATVNNNLPLYATSFATESAQSTRSSRSAADTLHQRMTPAIANLVGATSQQSQAIISRTRSQNETLATSTFAEVDSATEQARGEVRGINDNFRREIRNGANESIQEAIKPRTDRVEDRAAEAAERAGESWYVGLFRAIGEIVVGLVILVVVALVVAAIAAAFGVILTAWGAIMIAGGLLLAAGLIMSLVNRSQQQEFREAGLGTQILVVAGDTLGLTNLVEGATGQEVLTGQRLGASERTRRATLGAFAAVMLVLGARGLAKGGPRPGFVRGTAAGRAPGISMPSSWAEVGAGIAEGVRSVGGELYTGARQGVRNLAEWGRRQGERIGLRRPVAPEEPAPAPRPTRQPEESQADYMQRLREWNNARRAQQQYETTSDTAIAGARMEIEDPVNQRWWDQATQRERRLAYDPAHEGLVADLGVNEARVGLNAERQGIIEGPIRRHQGLGAEFEDASGVEWDVKSGRTPRSNYVDSLIEGENILVDRSGITDPSGALDEAGFTRLIEEIATELRARGRADIIGQLGNRIRPVPPLTNLPVPPIVPTPRPSGRSDEGH